MDKAQIPLSCCWLYKFYMEFMGNHIKSHYQVCRIYIYIYYLKIYIQSGYIYSIYISHDIPTTFPAKWLVLDPHSITFTTGPQPSCMWHLPLHSWRPKPVGESTIHGTWKKHRPVDFTIKIEDFMGILRGFAGDLMKHGRLGRCMSCMSCLDVGDRQSGVVSFRCDHHIAIAFHSPMTSYTLGYGSKIFKHLFRYPLENCPKKTMGKSTHAIHG